MVALSLKSRRLADLRENGRRTARPCMRCLDAYAEGRFDDGCAGCTVPVTYTLWASMLTGGKQFVRCFKCTVAGQDCFGPPDHLPTTFAELEAALNVFMPHNGTDPTATAVEIQTAKDDAAKIAGDLLSTLQDAYKPYAQSLTAHSGQLALAQSAQSGVFLKGRDRSKKAVLKKEAARKRALEESSDSEVELTPKKRSKFGIRGVGKTETEVANEAAVEAADAEADAARAAKRSAAAKKGAATRKKNRNPDRV